MNHVTYLPPSNWQISCHILLKQRHVLHHVIPNCVFLWLKSEFPLFSSICLLAFPIPLPKQERGKILDPLIWFPSGSWIVMPSLFVPCDQVWPIADFLDQTSWGADQWASQKMNRKVIPPSARSMCHWKQIIVKWCTDSNWLHPAMIKGTTLNMSAKRAGIWTAGLWPTKQEEWKKLWNWKFAFGLGIKFQVPIIPFLAFFSEQGMLLNVSVGFRSEAPGSSLRPPQLLTRRCTVCEW